MNCVLCICLVFILTSAESTLTRKPRWKMGPDLASSAELADMFAKPKSSRAIPIDMDYFGEVGGSSERMRSQTSDESSDESPQMNPAERINRVVVFITDPRVAEYQRKLKGRTMRGPSSESDVRVTNEDILKFLIQAGTRIKQQQGANPLSQHPNLVDLLRNVRRRTDDDIFESVEPQPARLDSIEIMKPRKKKLASIEAIRKKKESVEVVYKSPRNKRVSIEELSRGKRKRKNSNEEFRPKKYGMNGRMWKAEAPSQRISFIRTPKPYIGKQGIYEEK